MHHQLCVPASVGGNLRDIFVKLAFRVTLFPSAMNRASDGCPCLLRSNLLRASHVPFFDFPCGWCMIHIFNFLSNSIFKWYFEISLLLNFILHKFSLPNRKYLSSVSNSKVFLWCSPIYIYIYILYP